LWSPEGYFLQKIEKEVDWGSNVVILESFYFPNFVPKIHELKI
jgi:hypothetical protein